MLETAKVIQNPSKKFKGIAGLELLVFNPVKQFPNRKNERVIINPMTTWGYEKFYKSAFEDMGREWISDDYKHFLKYMLHDGCEFTSTITIDDLKDVREVNEEDLKAYNRAFEKFVKENGLNIREGK